MSSCARCGRAAGKDASFCAACGAPLTESAPGSQPVPSRKTVTVLFADVSGFTALGERLDPESLEQVMSQYFAEMRRVVERHGGTVEKLIGDGIMAVFGAPLAHEDDPERAVRCALGMLAAIEELN
jgi:class 3 adenylate cyclase